MKPIYLVLFFMFLLPACDDRSAEEIGKDLAKEKIDIVKGAGEVVKDEGESVADTVAQGVGNIFTGLSSGFDESLIKDDVRVSELLQTNGLEVSRAQGIDSTRDNPRYGLSLYLTSSEGFSQHVRLVAISDEIEVGRSNVEVNLDKDGAGYYDFEFDKRTPFSVVQYYMLIPIPE